jgi:hypothetical protein
MAMNNRLMLPKASGASAPVFTTKGYSRVWGLTTKSSGNVTGTAASDTGYYAVKWWDNTTTVYADGDTFSKAAAGNQRAFEIYPAVQAGTSLLLNFNGSNGSTTFTDSSPNGLTVTAVGGAAISTAQSKFGGASAYFDGNGDYLQVSNEGEFDFGTGDFTIEAWVYPTDASYPNTIVGKRAAGESDLAFVLYVFGGTTYLVVSSNGTGWELNGGGTATVNNNAWGHIALVRNGSTFSVYWNGVLSQSFSSSSSIFNSSVPLRIGGGGAANQDLVGYIDDLRITKGLALYTANFTPPTGPASAVPFGVYPSGQFDGFDISSNALTKVRAESVSLGSTAAVPGGWAGKHYNPGTPASYEGGVITNNLLPAAAIDQFYADLDAGTGHLFVADNPGIVADTPTIATAKGYTVFGSVPPTTSLLMNFNGNLADSSPLALTATAQGNAVVSTAQSKFGGSSLYLDGSSTVTIPYNAAFDFGDGDFTIEAWVRPSSSDLNTPYGLVCAGGFPSGWASYTNGGDNQTSLNTGSPYWSGNSLGPSPADDVWSHIAFTKQGTLCRCYVNGVLNGTATISGAFNANSEPLTIGSDRTSGGYKFIGYIDDLRIVKGIALYTANFTPPAAQLGVWYF